MNRRLSVVWRRLCSILLVFVMVFSLVPVRAGAEENDILQEEISDEYQDPEDIVYADPDDGGGSELKSAVSAASDDGSALFEDTQGGEITDAPDESGQPFLSTILNILHVPSQALSEPVTVEALVRVLSSSGRYAESGIPKVGDVVFLDDGEDGTADRAATLVSMDGSSLTVWTEAEDGTIGEEKAALAQVTGYADPDPDRKAADTACEESGPAETDAPAPAETDGLALTDNETDGPALTDNETDGPALTDNETDAPATADNETDAPATAETEASSTPETSEPDESEALSTLGYEAETSTSSDKAETADLEETDTLDATVPDAIAPDSTEADLSDPEVVEEADSELSDGGAGGEESETSSVEEDRILAGPNKAPVRRALASDRQNITAVLRLEDGSMIPEDEHIAVEYQLLRKGSGSRNPYEPVGNTLIADASNDYTVTWENLYRYNVYNLVRAVKVYQDGKELEGLPDPYLSDVYDGDGVENRLKGGVYSERFRETWTKLDEKENTINVTVTWDDQNDKYGCRPSAGTDAFYMYPADDPEARKAAASAVDNGDGTWSLTYVMPARRSDGSMVKKGYAVSAPNGYSMSVDPDNSTPVDIQVTATYRIRTYKVIFSPSGLLMELKNQGIEFPQPVTATLKYKSGEHAGETVQAGGKDAVYEFRPDPDDTYSWGYESHTWEFPVFDKDGNQLIDPDADLFEVEWSSDFEGDHRYHTSIKTDLSSSTFSVVFDWVEMRLYYRDRTVNAVWDDAGDAAGLRPEKLSYTIVRTSKSGETREVFHGTLDTSYFEKSTYDSTTLKSNLAEYDPDGNLYSYAIRFDDLPDCYSAEVRQTPLSYRWDYYTKIWTYSNYVHFTMPDMQTLSVTKRWTGDGIGSDAEIKNRPENVYIRVYYSADKGVTWKHFWGRDVYAVTGDPASTTWQADLPKLPDKDPDGSPVIYRMEETGTATQYTAVNGTPVYSTDAETGEKHTSETITNAYRDNWNYKIDLHWDESDPGRRYSINEVTLGSVPPETYDLSISVQKPYDVGEFRVSIPYELFDARSPEVKGTVAGEFSIGDEKNPTATRSFTYRIDDKGTPDTSDDEVIFYNYKPLSTSGNYIIPVKYNIYAYKVTDCSTGTLTAHADCRYKDRRAGKSRQAALSHTGSTRAYITQKRRRRCTACTTYGRRSSGNSRMTLTRRNITMSNTWSIWKTGPAISRTRYSTRIPRATAAK